MKILILTIAVMLTFGCVAKKACDINDPTCHACCKDCCKNCDMCKKLCGKCDCHAKGCSCVDCKCIN